MADYHFIYKDVEGSSTQWDDIQRKLGNLPPKQPAFKPDPFTPAEDNDHKTEEDPEDDFANDPFIQEYKRHLFAKITKFGSIISISGSDFVREVSQAPSDVWVVVVLYKDGYSECGVLLQCMKELATMYRATKFVKIVSTSCIPDYPDRNLPTVLVYNDGALKANHVGLRTFGRRCTPEGVAMVLCQSDPVLNDGRTGGEGSREAVLEGIRKRFLEKVIIEHENDDDGSASD
ncbi:hypothetical protein M8C21_009152 [Ambrosia artemisiifolia]|uniref:Phosducin domain-containing protein n=1 Tax=Ambrosia artemisiifolia TaxID=4212 RepID=A0AAD5BSU1_AMBAR|nr:hypothetical protein M8C21_009152 [Ambrosia artemisiifolia]